MRINCYEENIINHYRSLRIPIITNTAFNQYKFDNLEVTKTISSQENITATPNHAFFEVNDVITSCSNAASELIT